MARLVVPLGPSTFLCSVPAGAQFTLTPAHFRAKFEFVLTGSGEIVSTLALSTFSMEPSELTARCVVLLLEGGVVGGDPFRHLFGDLFRRRLTGHHALYALLQQD